VRRLLAVAWLAGSSGFSDESALEVAPPDRRSDSRPTAFTTMRYINRRSLPLPLHVKLPLRFHKAQQGVGPVGRHIKTIMAQAFLSEIVIKMHRSK